MKYVEFSSHFPDEETGSGRPGHRPKATHWVSVQAGIVLESVHAGGQSSISTDLGLCPGSEVTGSGGEMG